MKRCKACGEPEETKGFSAEGGDFGWFDGPDGLICNSCGRNPITGRRVAERRGPDPDSRYDARMNGDR